jgi:hypothetical protein
MDLIVFVGYDDTTEKTCMVYDGSLNMDHLGRRIMDSIDDTDPRKRILAVSDTCPAKMLGVESSGPRPGPRQRVPLCLLLRAWVLS